MPVAKVLLPCLVPLEQLRKEIKDQRRLSILGCGTWTGREERKNSKTDNNRSVAKPLFFLFLNISTRKHLYHFQASFAKTTTSTLPLYP